MTKESVGGECLFCRIVRGEMPVKLLQRTYEWVAFADIAPQAPEHVLVVPTQHIPAVSQHPDPAMLGRLVAAAAQFGVRLGNEAGFRLVINEGPQGGQTVDHLHIHVLTGRQMTWPPG